MRLIDVISQKKNHFCIIRNSVLKAIDTFGIILLKPIEIDLIFNAMKLGRGCFLHESYVYNCQRLMMLFNVLTVLFSEQTSFHLLQLENGSGGVPRRINAVGAVDKFVSRQMAFGCARIEIFWTFSKEIFWKVCNLFHQNNWIKYIIK